MPNKTIKDLVSQIKNLLDELEEAYAWDIEHMQEAIDEKTDLLDKYVSENENDDV